MCVFMWARMFTHNSGTGGTAISKFQGSSRVPQRWFQAQKWGVMDKSQKTSVYHLSQDQPAKCHCTVWALGTRHTRRCNRALVLTGPYYTWVREAGALGRQTAGCGCLCNARLGGQNGQFQHKNKQRIKNSDQWMPAMTSAVALTICV